MTAHELAELMVRLGADRAINLDGGGSSIMLVADAEGDLEIVNRPSGGQPRPIPVLLGVRRRAQ
jgi:exopolysaccharide biosynthesis protein